MNRGPHDSARVSTRLATGNSSKRHTPIVVVMGVTGSGKSTVGPIVASKLHVPFIDGDEYHDPENVERMRAGLPLDDARRQPWLDRLHAVLVEHARHGIVLACSALTQEYRHRLRGDLAAVTFVALQVGRKVLKDRVANRAGHFAGPELVESQLGTLHLDGVITVDGERRPDEIADAILAAINAGF